CFFCLIILALHYERNVGFNPSIKSAIAVRSKSPIPNRQKICQSIGNKNTRVSTAPHMADMGNARNIPNMKRANSCSKVTVILNIEIPSFT
ncbi:MAG: hypothetical protein WCP16_25830, partial [Pseudanabaena sp. ELA645]